MTGERVVRRLAAILAADVVGYSRLMGRDEQGTLTRLKAHRTERLEPTLARHGGRLVKLTGDGALAEFPSAVDALGAAIEFQQAMVEANAGQPDDTAIVFRIGLHLGDLIVDGDDLYGDGVNVAARLEAEAPAGGIVISRNVHDAAAGRLKATFDDLGSLALKNIERPVQAFGVKWEAVDWKRPAASNAAAALPATDAPLALPDKPSIAVLPFQNMSGDPEQEYFADGMVEEVVTTLSWASGLFVISSNSSLTYKGHAVDIRQVGRELGVRYVLEGSVDKAGGRISLSGQLTDATTDSYIWAERFEGCLDDIFELQKQVAARVLSSIAPVLGPVDIDRARRKPTKDLVAYDHFLRGKYCLDRFTKEANRAAFDHFQEASCRAPEFALPRAFSAICYLQRKTWGWSTDPIGEMALAESLARRALELDASDPRVLANVGWVFAHIDERLDEGAVLLDRSVDLDPNSALGWSWRATAKVMLGEKNSRIIEDYERALRLSPFDPRIFMTLNGLARAHFLAGHYDEAASWAIRALQEHPKHLFSFRCLCASHALAGRFDEARQAYERYQELDPSAQLSNIKKWLRLRCDEDVEMFARGLRLAGMPE